MTKSRIDPVASPFATSPFSTPYALPKNHAAIQENLKISYDLAIAIGWNPKHIRQVAWGVQCLAKSKITNTPTWRTFDYMDNNVIYPIAQNFDCFPSAIVEGNYAKATKNNKPTIIGWECLVWSYKYSGWNRVTANTPQKAIALAIILRDIPQEL